MSILILYLAITVLHILLPYRLVEGYARDEQGEPLTYRLNGMRVLGVSVVGWLLLGWTGLVPLDQLWVDRWENAAVACGLGLLFTLVTVLPHPAVRSLPVDLFLGRAVNLQWLDRRVDAKMWLYLVGAVTLELHALAATAHHLQSQADASPGVLLHLAMLTWFVMDYLTFEEVHLYTYDLFAERVGFKLGWGCLFFYPFFYPVGLWALADAPDPHRSTLWLVVSAVIFLGGWSLARGANMQKFLFKRDPSALFLGRITPHEISNGSQRLLTSGFWGLSRHINYLGEIGMATGLALALGYPTSPWPWLYPLYYVLLLVPRERDDDARCAEKYGPLWDLYRKQVPYRIVPGIY